VLKAPRIYTRRCASGEFDARAHEAIDQTRRDGSGLSPEQLLHRMDERLFTARERLARRARDVVKAPDAPPP